MPAYRPPRVGDLLAVRTTDPHLSEVQVLVDRVTDTGQVLTIAGSLGAHDIEVVLRRVGAPSTSPS